MTHLVAGIYPDAHAATTAYAEIEGRATDDHRVLLAGPADRTRAERFIADQPHPSEGGTVATSATVGAGMGLAAGAAAGAMLVVAAPVIAALAATGLGALAGAAAGKVLVKSVTGEALADVVLEALDHGHWTVLVSAADEAAALDAQDLVARTHPEESVDHGGGTHTELR